MGSAGGWRLVAFSGRRPMMVSAGLRGWWLVGSAIDWRSVGGWFGGRFRQWLVVGQLGVGQRAVRRRSNAHWWIIQSI